MAETEGAKRPRQPIRETRASEAKWYFPGLRPVDRSTRKKKLGPAGLEAKISKATGRACSVGVRLEGEARDRTTDAKAGRTGGRMRKKKMRAKRVRSCEKPCASSLPGGAAGGHFCWWLAERFE